MGFQIRDNKAITLIALVITIIVLLILAGVSIAMLTGENGILTKAQTSSDHTKQKGASEKVKLAVAGSLANDGKINIEELKNNLNNVEGIDKSTIKESLPMTVKVDGYEVNIENTGKVELNKGGSEETELPSTDNTKPYLPSNEFSKVEGTDLNTGLVIKDKDGNSYVWVEVPKTIYTTATSNTDYSNIETDMQVYAADYRKGSSEQNYNWSDTWYNGCAIETETQYNELKQKMLKSVYDNGGFWISQYEIGTNIIRTKPTDELTTPMSKEGLYVYNYVTATQAQVLASSMNSGNYNNSLLYGIQWDLTLKHLESKGVKTKDELKTDSLEWGNYYNSTFDIVKGKYSTDNGATYTEVIDKFTKPININVLLTTGATQRNCALNIYDLAGNEWEWTLEKSTDAGYPGSCRGGRSYSNGSTAPAAFRIISVANGSNEGLGVRFSIY